MTPDECQRLWEHSIPAGDWIDGDPELTRRPDPAVDGTLSDDTTVGPGVTAPGEPAWGPDEPTVTAAGDLPETATAPSAARDGGASGNDTPLRVPVHSRAVRSCALSAGKVNLVEEIARGGMGIVYRARQECLAREVAVKCIGAHADRPGVVERFVSESLVTGMLDHPNIVPVHDMSRGETGELFLAMKLVDGMSWRQLMHPRTAEERERAARLDLKEHLDILVDVGNAVAFAHSRGIIHRDLKPENVMVGEFGEVLVMDWGIAVDVGDPPDPEGRAPHKTTVRHPAGTPAYLAPEMALGQGRLLGPWTDVFLLGAILYEILSGHPPYRGDSLMAVLVAAGHGRPPPLPEDAPAGLGAICTRAMARQPVDRYRDVASFQQAIRDFLTHRESEAIAAAARRAVAGIQPGPVVDQADRPAVYGCYAEALAGFRQALVLWEGNAAAAEDEVRVRRDYARAALAAGDLGLAETQARSLPTGDTELRREIDVARAAIAHARRTQRRIRIGFYGSLAVIVLGVLVGAFLIDRERRATGEALVKAEAALASERQAREAETSARRETVAAKEEARGFAELSAREQARLLHERGLGAIRAGEYGDAGACLLEAVCRRPPGGDGGDWAEVSWRALRYGMRDRTIKPAGLVRLPRYSHLIDIDVDRHVATYLYRQQVREYDWATGRIGRVLDLPFRCARVKYLGPGVIATGGHVVVLLPGSRIAALDCRTLPHTWLAGDLGGDSLETFEGAGERRNELIFPLDAQVQVVGDRVLVHVVVPESGNQVVLVRTYDAADLSRPPQEVRVKGYYRRCTGGWVMSDGVLHHLATGRSTGGGKQQMVSTDPTGRFALFHRSGHLAEELRLLDLADKRELGCLYLPSALRLGYSQVFGASLGDDRHVLITTQSSAYLGDLLEGTLSQLNPPETVRSMPLQVRSEAHTPTARITADGSHVALSLSSKDDEDGVYQVFYRIDDLGVAHRARPTVGTLVHQAGSAGFTVRPVREPRGQDLESVDLCMRDDAGRLLVSTLERTPGRTSGRQMSRWCRTWDPAEGSSSERVDMTGFYAGHRTIAGALDAQGTLWLYCVRGNSQDGCSHLLAPFSFDGQRWHNDDSARRMVFLNASNTSRERLTPGMALRRDADLLWVLFDKILKASDGNPQPDILKRGRFALGGTERDPWICSWEDPVEMARGFASYRLEDQDGPTRRVTFRRLHPATLQVEAEVAYDDLSRSPYPCLVGLAEDGSGVWVRHVVDRRLLGVRFLPFDDGAPSPIIRSHPHLDTVTHVRHLARWRLLLVSGPNHTYVYDAADRIPLGEWPDASVPPSDITEDDQHPAAWFHPHDYLDDGRVRIGTKVIQVALPGVPVMPPVLVDEAGMATGAKRELLRRFGRQVDVSGEGWPVIPYEED